MPSLLDIVCSASLWTRSVLVFNIFIWTGMSHKNNYFLLMQVRGGLHPVRPLHPRGIPAAVRLPRQGRHKCKRKSLFLFSRIEKSPNYLFYLEQRSRPGRAAAGSVQGSGLKKYIIKNLIWESMFFDENFQISFVPDPARDSAPDGD